MAKATRLPKNVTAPMRPLRTVARAIWSWGASLTRSGTTRAPPATRTEAPPPKPFRSATISGIEVILTRAAMMAPMEPPTSMPAKIAV